MKMKMPRWPDHCVATITWLAVVLASYAAQGYLSDHLWLPLMQFGLVLAATLNLLHARYVAWSAGAPFELRVREVVREEFAVMHADIAECQRGVEDVKQAQIAIAGQFRGAGTRNHP